MNNEIEKILKNVRSSAYSLEVFAEQAISEHSPEDHKQDMLDGVLMMLGGLEELHAQLKQIMEGSTNA